MDVCPKLKPVSNKQKKPFLQLSARVKFSDCLLGWRELDKTCKIVLHAVGNFSFSTHTRILQLKEKAIFKRTARTDFKMLSQKKKTAEPNRKLIFLLLSKPTSLATTMRSPKRRLAMSYRARRLSSRENVWKLRFVHLSCLSVHRGTHQWLWQGIPALKTTTGSNF